MITHNYLRSVLPNSVGFDRLLSTLEEVNNVFGDTPRVQNYPPYNILKTGDHTYQIEIAVAGFDQKEIDINLENRVLIVSSNHNENEKGLKNYIHRGIALRNFLHRFILAETVEVREATFDNGLLSIKLENNIPESKKPRKIPIGTKQLLQE